MKIETFSAKPVSMVTSETTGRQRVELAIRSNFNGHVKLRVFQDDVRIRDDFDLALQKGENNRMILVPPPVSKVMGRMELYGDGGEKLAAWQNPWEPPRQWVIYIISSSHTDIGLHNSPYFQRWQSEQYIDEAARLSDEAEKRNPPLDYHYLMEGTWFWNNYGMDRGRAAACRIRDRYIRSGKLGVCCGIAGNHTQTFGLEEMCRSAYTRRQLEEQWGIDSHTMSMIDNNGISWALIAPYAEAGYRNIIFAPNQWNPLPSTVWPCDVQVPGSVWNPDANGGGARIDVRYDSEVPMVFYWMAPDREKKLLVWCSTQYDWGAVRFGLRPGQEAGSATMQKMEASVAKTLPLLESKVPYDLWLAACYADDEKPSLRLAETFAAWNAKWKIPQFKLVGNPDEPFDRLRSRFDAQIPTLHGDITGGWYQHPLAAPDYLADKFKADQALPTAEKLSVLAALTDPEYRYPAESFRRAWHALLLNDEHSYGTSGYQGRRVYETWLQHRDWIDFAARTAQDETRKAMEALVSNISLETESIILFNPVAFPRRERVAVPGRGEFLTPEIPPLGYKAIAVSAAGTEQMNLAPVPKPCVLENRYYRIAFASDGSFLSVFDKELGHELFDPKAPFRGNQFVYTDNNHRSFHTPLEGARFEAGENALVQTVRIRTAEPVSGATVEMTVSLPAYEKRIDLEVRLDHVRDLVNRNRYYRYGYFAFPFLVEQASRKVRLNGCMASPGPEGQTGQGTETYLAAREWCCVENGAFGVALFLPDSQLVEFDHIHPDKTDCFLQETGSAVYAYLFNDWLQMHTPGGSHVNLAFRFSIVSYDGDYRTSGVPEMAERLTNPLVVQLSPPHEGVLPGEKSFAALPDGMRLLALKRAEDGDGVILRMQETRGALRRVDGPAFAGVSPVRVSVDEGPFPDTADCLPFSTATFRYRGISIREAPVAEPEPGPAPAPVGSWYTGLITEPRACCGEKDGQLYLIWGQNREENLSHYELYRSRESGFLPERDSFLARVEPGPYRVGLYEDTGLSTHTRYFYRVRAVNKEGIPGAFSREFSGITREPLPE